jgi:hypothetical protein
MVTENAQSQPGDKEMLGIEQCETRGNLRDEHVLEKESIQAPQPRILLDAC